MLTVYFVLSSMDVEMLTVNFVLSSVDVERC